MALAASRGSGAADGGEGGDVQAEKTFFFGGGGAFANVAAASLRRSTLNGVSRRRRPSRLA